MEWTYSRHSIESGDNRIAGGREGGTRWGETQKFVIITTFAVSVWILPVNLQSLCSVKSACCRLCGHLTKRQSLMCCLKKIHPKPTTNKPTHPKTKLKKPRPSQKMKVQYAQKMLSEWLDIQLKKSVRIVVTKICSEAHRIIWINELNKYLHLNWELSKGLSQLNRSEPLAWAVWCP